MEYKYKQKLMNQTEYQINNYTEWGRGRFSWEEGEVLEVDGGGDCTTIWVYLTTPG